MNGGFIPCQQLRQYSGLVFILIQSGDVADGKKETENILGRLVRHAWDTVDLFYPRVHKAAVTKTDIE